MNLINEKNVAGGKVAQNGRKVADSLDGGTGSRAHVCPECSGDEMRECCFPESRRAIEEDVLCRLPALARGGEENPQIFLHLRLSNILIPCLWPNRLVQGVPLSPGVVKGGFWLFSPITVFLFLLSHVMLSTDA